VVGKDGKAYSRTVKVLNDDGVNDAIQGEVKPGDEVVTDGQLRVTPGQPVRVMPVRVLKGGRKSGAPP
jgi:multidrug efflux pump subunit AcrA (membrane-fusion protein)